MMIRRHKSRTPAYVVLAGEEYEGYDPFAVITGEDAKAWAERLRAELLACKTDAQVARLAKRWKAEGFDRLYHVRDVRVCEVPMTVYLVRTSEGEHPTERGGPR